MRNLLIVFIGVCFLSGCISEQDMTAVESAIAEFHARQAARDDQAIYANAGQEFRNAATLAQLSQLNDAVRMAEGCSPPARDKLNFSSRVSTSGTFITVAYVRTCTEGTLTEQFVMRMEGGHPQIEGFHISGNPILASPAS